MSLPTLSCGVGPPSQVAQTWEGRVLAVFSGFNYQSQPRSQNSRALFLQMPLTLWFWARPFSNLDHCLSIPHVSTKAGTRSQVPVNARQLPLVAGVTDHSLPPRASALGQPSGTTVISGSFSS